MRKKILSLWFIIAVSTQQAFAMSVQQVADNAILRTQRESNYGRYTISTANGNTSTVWFLKYESDQYEWDFKLAVNNGYNLTQTGATGFIQHMDSMNDIWVATYNSGSLWVKERAKNILWSNIYKNFRMIWLDPSSDVPMTNTGASYPNTATGVVVWWNRTYTSIGSYNTLNDKTYTLWSSNDGYYRFKKWIAPYFRSETQLINYIEVQNRLIYTAPNGRRYGIFKMNNRYYFNRDEGSVSTLSRATTNDVKAYINQHNQSEPFCPMAKERKCY